MNDRTPPPTNHNWNQYMAWAIVWTVVAATIWGSTTVLTKLTEPCPACVCRCEGER